MTTARKIVERAFSKINVRAAETPLTAAEISDGLDVLNDLLEAWDASGILKGVESVQDADKDLMEPRASTWALKSNVAILLAGEYGIEVTPAIANDAVDSVNQWISGSINLQNLEYPSTLPIGTGNRDEYGYGYDRDFFPEDDKRNF
jgi:hypothetical protein